MNTMRLPLIALGLVFILGNADAQGPVEFKNPLEGPGLFGGGDAPKETKRIENTVTSRKILDSFKAGTGWAIAEVQTIDEKDGSAIVRYRKVVSTHTEGDNGKDAVVIVTLGPPTPWVKVPGKGKDDGPLTAAIAACNARLKGLDTMIGISKKVNEPTAELVAQKKAVQETLDALTK